MRTNRSIPDATVIPELNYADLPAAVSWLRDAFGFVERLRIGDHRAQLTLGAAAIVARHDPTHTSASSDHAIMVRVEDVDAQFVRAKQYGAALVRDPATHPFGERQCTVRDLGGHEWTFTQSVADVDPAEWGGELR